MIDCVSEDCRNDMIISFFHKFNQSRQGAMSLELLEPLTQSILDNWNYSSFDPMILSLGKMDNIPVQRYNMLYEY